LIWQRGTFTKVTRELASQTLTKETINKEQEGTGRTLSVVDLSRTSGSGVSAARRSLVSMSRKLKVRNALIITFL
jgi:hypothetical protein